MTETAKGIAAMISACVVWGLSGIYYKALSHVPPEQVLSHRALWSFVFFAIVLLCQGRISALGAALATRRSALLLAFASAMISLNWFIFITAVQVGYATEASLGYYIFPLLSVLLGRLAFGEQLTQAQWLAVGLAALAVAVLSFGLGAAPWIPLALSFSFALYGVVKKQLPLGPVVSVTAEVALLLPIALVIILLTGGAGFLGGIRDALMLMFSGILTGAAADPVRLCSPPGAIGNRRGAAVPEPDAAVPGGGAGLFRAFHRLARHSLCADLERGCGIFRLCAASGTGVAEGRDGGHWRVGPDQVVCRVLAGKSLADHVVQKIAKRVPVALGV